MRSPEPDFIAAEPAEEEAALVLDDNDDHGGRRVQSLADPASR